MEETCTTCKHVKFDKIWGEYKCLKHGHRMYKIASRASCSDYEMQDPKQTSDDLEVEE